MKILIDNGHGENTPGKRSPKWENGTQLLEWKYTREIAAEVVARLQKAGIDAQLLTPEDRDVPLIDRTVRANRTAKAYGNQNTLVVSIHVNAFDGKAHGWEIHTYKGQSLSDTYATILWNKAKELLGKTNRSKMRADWSDGDPDFESNFAILRDTSCPAVLTENLFMDNEDDCKFLLSKKGKETIIQIHVEGIKEIVNLK